MRTIVPCLLAIAGVAADPITATSRITAATVYLDRAWVEREASVQVPAGASRVLIAGLPAEIDEDSLRLSLSGGPVVEALTVMPVVVERQPGDELAAIERDFAAADAAVAEAADRAATFEKALALVTTLQDGATARPEGMSFQVLPAARPGPREHANLVAWTVEERLRLTASQRAAKVATGVASARRAALAARRDILARGERSESRMVAVDLAAPAAGMATLRLTYLLPGACWIPSYDARVDLDGSRLILEQEAMVQQATGEDWRDCRLTLCFARPTRQQQAPTVAPWVLTSGGAAPARVSAGVSAPDTQSAFDQNYATNGSIYNAGDNLVVQFRNRTNGKEAMSNLLKSSVMLNDICRVLSERSVAATYAPNGAVSIACDGRPHRVRLARVELPIALTRLAAPATSPDVSVLGRIANAGNAPWLPGAIHLFHGNDLIGGTTMPFTAPGDATDLWLGADDLVAVERTSDGSTRDETFWGGRRRVTGTWTIAVRNRRTVPVRVDVVDAVPTADAATISVRIGEVVPTPVAVERGVHRWRLDLAAGAAATVRWSATVEHPAGAEPAGLSALAPTR